MNLILKNGTVVDPLNGVCREADLAVEGGRIAGIGEGLGSQGARVVDCSGLVVQPGVIDSHIHISPDAASCASAAFAGVTTCLDMMGPAEKVCGFVGKRGCGINVAVLDAILPGRNVSGTDAGSGEIRDFIASRLAAGAFGVKLLGGHYPMTPGASARFFEEAERLDAYAAWHAGTTEKGSNIEGLEEAFELLAGRRVHMAHINAYCRGYVDDMLAECRRAARLLETHPEAVSESYVSPRSGGGIEFGEDGLVVSKVARTTLKRRGYGADRPGVHRAIRDGYLGMVRENENGVIERATGEEGVEWLESHPGCACAFEGVNPLTPRVFFASARRRDGTFLVDAIGTDGGAIPRNVILELGLSVVRLGGLTLPEFASKTSLLPSRMLGLSSKGHFTPGADADITVFDPVAQRAVMTWTAGEPCLEDGRLHARAGRIICTEAGEKAVRAAGIDPVVVRGGIPELDRRIRSREDS